MRTICSICLDEVGKQPLVTLVNCGHVFDLKCIREWLKTNLNCPFCRKGIHNMLEIQLCRIFLSTEGDSSSSECLKLKTDLEENAIVIQELKREAYNQQKPDETRKSSVYVEQIMDLTLTKKNEVDALKKNDAMARELQSQRDKCAAMAKNRNYKKEYFDLKKLFDDTLAKQNITNSKFIEIAISGTSSPDTVRYHIQGLEKQLTESKAKEDKFFADVKRLAKKKADIYQDRHKLYIENQKAQQ
ncbi:uncharacterized protein ATC70_012703 [Mucor velutinosus]|uniref:RING-type domain-containing protein n=1 Tax=Mucor velutinosus TaxID=708070 RepID=A0AAN7D5Y0_9FUNG|nr:hypothetical protein ATC70_012703 [Mucor velutinosus]